jgi:hypothetical protein
MNNIPEKFQNSDGTLNTDALLKSYSELEKKDWHNDNRSK